MKKIESEKTLEKRLSSEMRKIGGWAIKLWPISISGLPDRLCLFPGGRVAFAEIKTTGEDTTPIQKAIHKRLLKMGFIVDVIDNTDDLLSFMDDNYYFYAP